MGKAVQLVVSLFCTWEVLGSNTGPDLEVLTDFVWVPLGKCQNSVRFGHYHYVSHSYQLITGHRVILRNNGKWKCSISKLMAFQVRQVGSPARRARLLAARQWNALDTVTLSLRAVTSYIITQLHDLVLVLFFIGNSYVWPLEITTVASIR